MKGCRPLSPIEIQSLEKNLSPISRCIFHLGLATGFRISELLSLNTSDVSNGTEIKTHVYLQKKNTKGKTEGRTIPLSQKARAELNLYLSTNNYTGKLFPITRGAFHKALKLACERAQIDATRVATHSMRKTFADKFYKASSSNIVALKNVLGHSSTAITEKYLGVSDELINDIVAKM